MQLLARSTDHPLGQRGERATILGATSGDTGGAAVEAFRAWKRVEVVALLPEGRVDEVQRRQITTREADNVPCVAVEGAFDDCQALVKAIFHDHAFGTSSTLLRRSTRSTSPASSPRRSYYFTTAAALGAPHRPVTFSVPSGNFGDALRRLRGQAHGPAHRPDRGRHQRQRHPRPAPSRPAATSRRRRPTTSPAMDIESASNFERLLSEAQRDGGGRPATDPRPLAEHRLHDRSRPLAAIRLEFSASAVGEDEVRRDMGRDLPGRSATRWNPHTAIGLASGRAALRADPSVPMVALGTAHPAKFPTPSRRRPGSGPASRPSGWDLLDAAKCFTTHGPQRSGPIENVVRSRARAAGDLDRVAQGQSLNDQRPAYEANLRVGAPREEAVPTMYAAERHAGRDRDQRSPSPPRPRWASGSGPAPR